MKTLNEQRWSTELNTSWLTLKNVGLLGPNLQELLPHETKRETPGNHRELKLMCVELEEENDTERKLLESLQLNSLLMEESVETLISFVEYVEYLCSSVSKMCINPPEDEIRTHASIYHQKSVPLFPTCLYHALLAHSLKSVLWFKCCCFF